MGSRLVLQAVLENILGSHEAYFQPPSSVRMKYPAIVYSLKNLGDTHANDSVYRRLPEYELIVIDADPEGEISQKVSMLQYCRFVRRYTANGHYHDVYALHF